jgi:hypothetical protein
VTTTSPIYLGSDPAVAPAYDTAVLGMILGFLASGYQALALLRRQDVDPDGLPDVIRDYWPFIIGLSPVMPPKSAAAQ